MFYRLRKNNVMIDEKWFNQMPRKKKLKYMPDHLHYPNHSVQHKSHIQRLMITSVLSDTFDEKVGLIYHGEMIPAPNRPRGSIELTSKSVDSEEFYNGQIKVNGIINMILEKKNQQFKLVIHQYI